MALPRAGDASARLGRERGRLRPPNGRVSSMMIENCGCTMSPPHMHRNHARRRRGARPRPGGNENRVGVCKPASRQRAAPLRATLLLEGAVAAQHTWTGIKPWAGPR
jgi:hypothetical protein